MEYPARIRKLACGTYEVQTVEEHGRNVALCAQEQALPELKHTAYLAGFLHDFGKYTTQFKEYIEKVSAGLYAPRGSVNHTFAGVRFVMEQWHKSREQSFETMTAELIAYAIGAHHGQFDCINPDGRNGYDYRQTKEGIDYPEAKQQFLTQCANEAELDELFAQAVAEIMVLFRRMEAICESADELYFYLSLFARLLLSLIIDGDRTDAARFMHGQSPKQQRDLPALWTQELEHMEQALSRMPADSEINRVRRALSDQCYQTAERTCGIFRLSVPTGGGKTLAGLRHALAVARKHGKRRIFFVIPLLSVLEQNADVIGDILENKEILLEHHSNLIDDLPPIDESSGDEQAIEERNKREYLMETWDSPMIITTLVQLLNTLFSGKTSSIRRMHALSDSVIVIDEVQSVPRKLLSLFNLALNFLSEICGAHIVLCSATQPCLERLDHGVRYSEPAELVTLPPEMEQVFRRTEIIDRRRPEGYTAAELATFSVACMEQEGNALLICNTKAQARGLFALVQLQGIKAFHLSTAMCMAHRRETLAEIIACLEHGERIVCVSTQLVEAGVDFSFGCVIRISAGLDNVVQAAGRCNRGGEKGRLCPVYIVNAREENLKYLPDIAASQQAAESVLAMYRQEPAAFGAELSSEAAISAYYGRLYTDLPKNSMDYGSKAHNTTIYAMLSENQAFAKNCPMRDAFIMKQAFQTAGKEFAVYEDNTQDVLVPYEEGAELIADLIAEEGRFDFQRRKELLQKAKAYTISLYAFEIKKIGEVGGLYTICEGSISVLRPGFYSAEQGLSMQGGLDTFWEV
jgi:CRISPR-associated helicase Cas3/CRISPR-associated endonuclease Cas3-HD